MWLSAGIRLGMATGLWMISADVHDDEACHPQPPKLGQTSHPRFLGRETSSAHRLGAVVRDWLSRIGPWLLGGRNTGMMTALEKPETTLPGTSWHFPVIATTKQPHSRISLDRQILANVLQWLCSSEAAVHARILFSTAPR